MPDDPATVYGRTLNTILRDDTAWMPELPCSQTVAARVAGDGEAWFGGLVERPLRVVELDHVVVRCRDQLRSLDFYTRVLGLTEERRLDAIGLIQLRAGASMVDLVPADPPPTDAGRNVDHFCLGIEANDMDRLVRYLREQSVEVLGDPMPRYGARGMGLSVYVLDPDGNIVELKQKAS